MSKLSKALLESFDSLDSFVREASPKRSRDKKQSLNDHLNFVSYLYFA